MVCIPPGATDCPTIKFFPRFLDDCQKPSRNCSRAPTSLLASLPTVAPTKALITATVDTKSVVVHMVRRNHGRKPRRPVPHLASGQPVNSRFDAPLRVSLSAEQIPRQHERWRQQVAPSTGCGVAFAIRLKIGGRQTLTKLICDQTFLQIRPG